MFNKMIKIFLFVLFALVPLGAEANESPVIDSLTADIQSNYAPTSVSFSCTARDPDGHIVNYKWDLNGDGFYEISGSSISTISNRYTHAGVYEITVVVVDNEGAETSRSIEVTIGEAPDNGTSEEVEISSFSAIPTQGEPPLEVTFRCEVSSSSPGILYFWDFDGDGEVDETTTTNFVSHTYTQEGEYNASVIVQVIGVGRVEDTILIRVGGEEKHPPEISSLSAQPGEDTMEVFLTCEATDTDGEVTEYFWDFDGDGIYDLITNSNSAHYVYNEEGIYNITVKVVDDDGLDATDSISFEARENATQTPPEIISFTASPVMGNVPLEVNFTCSAQAQGGGIREYLWDFDGDGIIDLSTPIGRFSYVYENVGTYLARVTVVGRNGSSTNATVEIDVLDSSIPITQGVNIIDKILSNGTITIEDSHQLNSTVRGIHENVSRDLQQGELTPEEARAIMRLTDDVVESHNILITRGLPADVENVNSFLNVLPAIKDRAIENTNVEVQEDIKSNLILATKKIENTAKILPPSLRSELKDGFKNLVNTSGDIYKTIVETATNGTRGKRAFVMAKRVLEDLPDFTNTTIAISNTLNENEIKDTIKEKQERIFTTLSQGIEDDAIGDMSNVNVEDVKKVNRVVSHTLSTLIKNRVLMDEDLLRSVSRVGGATLPAILDDVATRFNVFSNGFEGLDNLFSQNSTPDIEEILNRLKNRPYLYLKMATSLGLNLGEYLRDEQEEGYELPAPPTTLLYEKDGRPYSSLSVLNSTIGVNATTETRNSTALFKINGITLSVGIPDIEVIPVPPLSPALNIPSGKIVVYKDGLGLVITPSSANPEELLETLRDIGDQVTDIKFTPDGVLMAQMGNTKFVSRFGFVLGNAASFSQGGVTFSVSGTDPSSEAYRMLVTYSDGTYQALAPYPIAGDRIFDFLESLFPGQWTFDSESGTIVLMDSIKYKLDYNGSVLSSQEMDWYEENKDPNFGLAFKTGDYNNDGKIDIKVYSPEGSQIYWAM